MNENIGDGPGHTPNHDDSGLLTPVIEREKEVIPGLENLQEAYQEEEEPEEMQFENPPEGYDEPFGGQEGGEGMYEQGGILASEMLWGYLKNGIPELMRIYAYYPDSAIKKLDLPEAQKQMLLAYSAELRENTKKATELSDIHEKNILPPLQQTLQELKWETEIPAFVWLLVGLGVLAFSSIRTARELQASNERNMNKLIAEFRKHHQPHQEPEPDPKEERKAA